MHIPRPRIPYFLIFYSTTFTFFALLLAGLLLITPGDHIYQSFHAGELYRIIIVTAVYVLTFAIAVFIYAARLFSTRSALANIPREWNLSGNEKDNPGIGLGMGRRMGRAVRDGWERSAIISYESTPRDLKGGDQVRHIPSKKRRRRYLRRDGGRRSIESVVEPVWGTIKHLGWTGPESPDLPNLHFDSVIAELPNLIEAKAVSLAPVDPLWEVDQKGQEVCEQTEPSLDPVIIDLLRRPLHLSLGEYIGHLASLNMIQSEPQTSKAFLALYEEARFSGNPLSEEQFRRLMTLFSDILRHMQSIHQEDVDKAHLAAKDENSKHHTAEDMSVNGSIVRHGKTRRNEKAYVNESLSSMDSQSDAQATAYTAPSRARFSRSPSEVSHTSGSTSESVVHNKLRDGTLSVRTKISDASIASSSLASSSGSVVRAERSTTPLGLPLVFDDGARNT